MENDIYQNTLNRQDTNRNQIMLSEYKATSDCDKFMEGFAQLCKLCHVSDVYATKLGLIQLIFKDGTKVGMKPLLDSAGIYLNW